MNEIETLIENFGKCSIEEYSINNLCDKMKNVTINNVKDDDIEKLCVKFSDISLKKGYTYEEVGNTITTFIKIIRDGRCIDNILAGFIPNDVY